MYKTILISLLSTLFIGCSSSTNALKNFETDVIEAKSIQHTKKTDVKENNEPKALMWATYLNNIKHKDFKLKKETFLISLYFVDKKDINLKDSGYTLTLNGKKPISIKAIDKKEYKYKSLLKKNPWAQNYLVEFKRMKRVYKLDLTLSNSNTSSEPLKFEK